jgi:amino acid transporter
MGGSVEVATNGDYDHRPLLASSPSPDSSVRGRSLSPGKIGVVIQGAAPRKVTWIALASVAFFASASGPIGIESAVQAAGPVFTLIALALVALMWSVPQSLMSAELATMFAQNGGSVLWVESALGPSLGALNIYSTIIRNIIDLALYPVIYLIQIAIVLNV